MRWPAALQVAIVPETSSVSTALDIDSSMLSL
jgi:hypothetical protein